jgi:hypothetical protein
VSELDYDNDQSILNHTKAVPSEKTPGAITLHIDMPFGPPMTHTEMAPEQFKAIAGKWCEAVRSEMKNRELEKQAKARIQSMQAREAQLAAKLPESERARDEAQERRIIVPAGTQIDTSELRPGKVQVVDNTPTDPLSYALQQLTHWEKQYEQLKTAETRLEQWRKIVEGLST